MKNDIFIVDIECFPNYFEVGIKNFKTKEVINYELSDYTDDREEIYNFFSTFDGYLVTFNGISYDCMVLKYFLTHYEKLKKCSKSKCLLSLKKFSDAAINNELNWEKLKPYKYQNVTWTDIDLFCYWSKMLRMSKKISLKSLGIQLNYPVVQELPYSPNSILTKSQIDNVRHYNNVHDLGISDLLMQAMLPEISLRKAIKKDFNLDCMSWDAIKITSEALLNDYCLKTNQNKSEVRKWKWEKPEIHIREILSDFNPDFKLKIFQDLYERMLNSVNSFSEELLVNENNTSLLLSYGVGGLHNLFENKCYDSNKTHLILTSDGASLYPNLIINYKCIRFSEVLERYINIKEERMIAKKNKQKTKDLFFKLLLNGVSGLLDQDVSWLYFPEGALRMRLIGQLFLTKLIETCILNNWKVISVNTDGIEVIVPIEEVDFYKKTLEETAKLFKIDLEHDIYKFIYYVNVNNYIALTEKNKPKRKGLFKLDFNQNNEREIPLGDAVNQLIVAKALSNYFIHKIPIEESIENPEKYNFSIFDYCCSNKISKKDYEVWWNNEKVQNLNRYYFSKNSAFLFKKRKVESEKYKGSSKLEHLNVGWSVILYNEHTVKSFKDYKINYSYYTSVTRKIINNLQINKKQLSLFDEKY